MNGLFQRLDIWRQKQSRAPLTVPPGAAPDAIANAETALGVRLPEDLRTAYALRNPFWLPIHGDVQVIEELAELWGNYCGVWSTDAWGNASVPTGPVKPDWWNRRWIPFTFDQGCCHFVDMDPDAGGQTGQVVSYDCGDPRVALVDPKTTVVAPSFFQWVEKLVTDLDHGAIKL